MPATCRKKCPLHFTFLALLIATTLLAFLRHKRVSRQSFTFLVSPWQRPRAPDAVIIGVKKCGTRALLEMLSLHPRIVSAGAEVHFYDKFFARGTDWYRAQMPAAAPEQLIVEKTPAYFLTPLAPERMSAVNPDTLVVLVVRDPVARLVSDFAQLRAGGREGGREGGRGGGRNGGLEEFVFAPGGEVRHSRPVTTGLYVEHFLPWTRAFPPNQIHVVDGDQLIRDPATELAPIQTFLGLDQLIRPQDFYFNTSKGFYCWHAGERDRCLGEGKGRTHPNVSRDTLRKLRAFYKDANRAFFRALSAINKTAAFDWNESDLF